MGTYIHYYRHELVMNENHGGHDITSEKLKVIEKVQ